MAEEGNLGLGRASRESYDDEEPSKEELQRRMEEARESITQTVTEIKETVTNQYYSMKETVTDALDWRHHFRKNPIAFSVGALSVGFLVGYGMAGAFKGNGQDEREGYPSSEETDLFARTGATPQRYEDERARHSAFHGHSYAAQPITDGAYETASGEDERSLSSQAGDEAEMERPVKGANYIYSAPPAEEAEEDNKPSLFERFKETSAYDRLQAEVSSLGDRFIDELSKTAQSVVLPALFNKIKELFGVDLSGKQGQGQQQQQAHSSSSQETARATQPNATSSQGQNAQAASASASRGGSSYATSENRGYGSGSSEGGAANRNQDDSVLDLDR
jgi:hypothetical protein